MIRRQTSAFAATAPLLALAALGLGGAPVPLSGQAGAAVAVTPEGEVLVLRPSSGRGPAAVLVFTREGGKWVERAALRPGVDAEPYEGFGSSLAAGRGVIAAGGGDDDVVWGARVFHRRPGGWRAASAVPLEAGGPTQVATRPAALDMAGLMRIMSPPPRSVAVSPDGGTLAIWGAGARADSVRVLRRDGKGRWLHEALLPVRDSGAVRGIRLVMDGDRLVVGDPGLPGGGGVRVFARQGPGDWVLEAELTAGLPGATSGFGGAGFGAAVALAGGRLAVGIPGSGTVVVYGLAEGWWREEARLGGAAGDAGASLGAALAWSEAGLWVGAPAADDVRGLVRLYEPTADGGWSSGRDFTLEPPGPSGGPLGFGASLAAGAGVVVAGAPAAAKGAGGAAVLVLKAGAVEDAARFEPLETGVQLRGIAGREIRCEGGRAADFDCGNVDLLAYLAFEDLGAGPTEMVTDLWGWADPETGREYALVGRSAGMAVVDVTRPETPLLVAVVHGPRASLRDIKIFREHAFFVGDGAGDHGLLAFDLRRLRGLSAAGRPHALEPDARYGGFGSAHNLIMEPESGLAVAVGASGGGETCGGGLHMVDVSNPLEPVFAGCYTDATGLIAPGRTHDGQCVLYRGPDADWQDRRICIASNETAIRFVDVTDPAAPVEISSVSYPGVAYTHQGWLTDDHRYFYQNDELDELVGTVDRTRTLIWDIGDLDDPVLAGEHYGPEPATDHNLFIRGDRMYQANYQEGMRVVDISDPENPRDVGFFDTTPYGPDHPGFGSGAWSAYPFLPSGTVLVSSMFEGLFVLRPRPEPVP